WTGHRRPGPVVAAIVLVAVVAVGWGYGYPALRPSTDRGGPLADAGKWLRDNASGARVLVDDAAWAELADAGWPTGMLVAPAASVLRGGRVDPRLIATIAALAALQPVRVAAFPEVSGEDPAGQPRRRVLLTGGEDGAAAFYAGQRDLFRPSSVARTGGGVLVTYPLFAPPGLLVPF